MDNELFGLFLLPTVVLILQLKPNLDKEKDPMAGIMDLMKVSISFVGGWFCSTFHHLFTWKQRLKNDTGDHSKCSFFLHVLLLNLIHVFRTCTRKETMT